MADVTIDVCGEVCPMPVLKTKKALENINSGQTIEVICDYPPSKENVQRFVTSEGNEVLEVKEEGDKVKILIKKR
ncbi:MAG: hypothetical protein DRP55_06235 [Spirochaetes bacterium]|nr:sulfurtransferase TusA family protein [Deltaproteobacteria bacterium]RKY00142.1 MAG: hypothetical protein DRP55_06235 [Spirochaetota bacterium]RLA89826.1 MAG: hypothetical protein DRG20_04175 [Deltaproteobacteria bacterium]